jgi:two-component system, NarL family, nitrate/nitrite response regulator NarL
MQILVVDDHPLVLDAAANALRGSGTAQAVDCVTSLQEARKQLERGLAYALVVLDLKLQDADKLQGLLALREDYPDLPVLVFSAEDAPEVIAGAFENGARGYVPKSQPMEMLVNAVRMVLAGGTYIPPQALRVLGIELRATHPAATTKEFELPHLSPRQTDVFRLLLQGMPNKIIASRLGMAEGTVRAHLNSLFRSLQVHNRAQAILRARQYGLI